MLLESRGLTKAFGGLTAVNRVDFQVRRGELRSVIGPNGAGKTTFFNLLTGVLPPSGGRILFKGRDITGLPAHAVSRLGIARSYQVTNIFGDLTVFENVRIAAQSRVTHYRFWGNADRLAAVNERAEEILRHLGLAAKRHARGAELSHGEQRYLEIGIALATDPDFLLLDEPTAGMSPDETQRTAAFVRRLAGHVTIVVVEHDMEVVMGISDRITVLNYGEVLAEGTPGRDPRERRRAPRLPAGLRREPMLRVRVEGVDAYYGLSHVLQGVSLTVEAGEAVALLGRNGAGKTTTLKTIMAVVRARRGRITWNGDRHHGAGRPTASCSSGIGYVPEERRIFPNLSVYENLKMARLTVDGGRRMDDYLARVFELFPPLAERLSSKGKTLSGGEQQMLTMARSLGTEPKLLLIDEPTEGLMPAFVETISRTIVEIQRQGVAVLLVEQNTRLALEATQRVYLIEKGVIKHEARSSDLADDAEARRRYLGV